MEGETYIFPWTVESVIFFRRILPLNSGDTDWLKADALTITAQNNNIINLLFIYKT